MKTNEGAVSDYLGGIIAYLVRTYRLRARHDDHAERSWGGRRFSTCFDGRRHVRRLSAEYRLRYFPAGGYIDFQRHTVQDALIGRHEGASNRSIDLHVTANADGSVRRLYKHEENGDVRAIRSLSLKNYYTVRDDELARLLMITEKRLAWIGAIPVRYYPVGNMALKTIGSIEEFLAFFAGAGTHIPQRILDALDVGQIVLLLQWVPANHLNDIAGVIKRKAGRIRTASQALMYFYKERLGADCPSGHSIRWYLDACLHMGRKANLRLRSQRRMREERLEMVRLRAVDRVVEIRTASHLIPPRLEHAEIKFELLDSAGRLWEEAVRMHSCVDTYCHGINAGECSIYHVTYRGGDYTLEVTPGRDGGVRLAQLLGVRNTPPPPGLKRKIATLLRRHSGAAGSAPAHSAISGVRQDEGA